MRTVEENEITRNSKLFFNEIASKWDEMRNFDDKRLGILLKLTFVKKGERVLDVACGTGVLEEGLVQMGAENVLGLDLSEKMIEKARRKNTSEKVNFLVEDLYEFSGETFDRAIVFNAFPHFVDREKFAKKMFELVNENGELIILHSEGKEKINHRHDERASVISENLRSPFEEYRYFSELFELFDYADEQNIFYMRMIRK